MLTSKWAKRISILVAFLIVAASGTFLETSPAPAQAASPLVKGADVGWLSQLENQGVVWQDTFGVQKDVLQILKDNGTTAIRLRVFVNPPGDFKYEGGMLGYGDKNGVIWMALNNTSPQHGWATPSVN